MWNLKNKEEDLPKKNFLKWKSVFQVSYRMFVIVSVVLLLGFLIWAEIEFGFLNVF